MLTNKYLKIIFLFVILTFFIQPITSHENKINYTNYYDLLNQSGIKVVLNTLENQYGDSNLTSDECHFLLHELGAYASIKFGIKKSMQDATNSMELCRSGFIHGLFLSANLNQINNTDICTKNSFKNFALKLNCLHGLGHGLSVFFDYNLSQAMAVCKSEPNKKYQSACASGVFMEEFSPRAHSSINATKETFSICDKNDFKSECYWYVGIRIFSFMNNSLTETLKECKTANNSYQKDCERGIGVLATRRQNFNISQINLICQNNNECLFGAASEFGLSEGFFKGLSFCHSLSFTQKIHCYLEVINSFLNKSEIDLHCVEYK